MLLKNHHTIFIFLVFSFFVSLSQSEDQVDTIVYPKDNNIIQYCRDNAFYIKFDVRFSKNLTKIIPFEIELPLPNRLPFKCIIDGPKSNIFCFHSFNNHVWSLSADSRMEIPYSFPYIEGIRWDYDSFLRRIYRYLWRTTENCGLIYSREMRIDGNPVDNVKMVLEVSEISGGKCSASRYDYSFNMKLKLNEGEYVDQLKSAKENKKNYSMKFLNKFYVPVLIGDKRERGTTTFRKDYEYKYAICSYNEEINQNNFDKEDGFNFECHISVSRYIKFKGPLQIKPFTDLNYISSTDTEGKTSINLIQVKFEILASSQTKEPSELRNLKPVNINEINEPNFLILDSNLNIYICPDIPTLTIKNYNEGIQFGGINTSGSKFLFLLYGYLSNGYEYVNGTLTYLDMTKEEIKFYLKVTDNLETDNQKNQ